MLNVFYFMIVFVYFYAFKFNITNSIKRVIDQNIIVDFDFKSYVIVNFVLTRVFCS